MEQRQSLKTLIDDIDNGKIVLPEFQRDFVWEVSKTYELFDSIAKDIFVGSIIYGIPSFEIMVREIDNRKKVAKGKKRPSIIPKKLSIDEIEASRKIDIPIRLVLDGQQRTTSLYRSIKGTDDVYFISKNEDELDNAFDKCTLEELLFAFDGNDTNDRIAIKLSDVWDMDLNDPDEDEIKEKYFYSTDYYKNFSTNEDFDLKYEFKKYRYLKKKLTELFKKETLLNFYLLDMSLDKFVVFFERSNTRGIQLNFIDILAAKLYTGNFNLKDKIEQFKNANPNYELVPEIIVRTIAYLKSSPKEINRNYILSALKAEDFIQWWDILCNYYKISLDFLYQNKFIISQQWMPYENMLIPTMILLKEVGGDFHKLPQTQKEFYTYWYWNSVFSLRYSGSSNERVIEDSNTLSNIAKGNKISSNSFFNKLTKIQILSPDDIFSFTKKANAVYKGVLNIINYHHNGLIDWKNNSLLSLNSELEDHHIFPKGYLDEILTTENDKDYIDCVANRTLVPKSLNIKISDEKPSEYLIKISTENPLFSDTLKNHLIPIEVMKGDLDNDFMFFLQLRSNDIFEIIKENLIDKTEHIKQIFYEEQKVDESTNIPIFAIYKKQREEASFNPSSLKVFYRGQLFESPSAAAQQMKINNGAKDDTTENGWTFWKYINDNGDEKKIDELRKR